jgi:hypothetical protein
MQEKLEPAAESPLKSLKQEHKQLYILVQASNTSNGEAEARG